MNTTHETSDGENLIVVCDYTGEITFMRGLSKAKDWQSGAMRRKLNAAFGKVTV